MAMLGRAATMKQALDETKHDEDALPPRGKGKGECEGERGVGVEGHMQGE